MATSPQLARYGRDTIVVSGSISIARWDGNAWLCDCSSSPLDVTLPLAMDTNLASELFIKTDNSSNALTIHPASGQTIQGGSSWVVNNKNESCTVFNDGTTDVKVVSSVLSKYPSISDITTVSYKFINSNYTAVSTDSFIGVDASGGGVTVTLPLASSLSSASLGKFFTIAKTDNTANAVYIQTSGSEQIGTMPTLSSSILINTPYTSRDLIATTNTTVQWFIK